MSLLFGLLLLFADKPRLQAQDPGDLVLKIPAALLSDPSLERRLFSGLTTSLELDVQLKSATGSSRFQSLLTIRYQVWEEKVLVYMLEPGNQVSHQSFDKIEAFFSWLEEVGIKVAEAGSESYPLTVKATCRVVPYSAAEAAKTRDWFSQVLRVPRAGEQGLGAAETVSGEGGNGVFQVLMSQGIGRETHATYRWKWVLEKGRAP